MSTSYTDKVSVLLPIPDWCKRHRISRTTAFKLIKEKKVRAVKIGRSTRIPLADIEAFEQSLLEAADARK